MERLLHRSGRWFWPLALGAHLALLAVLYCREGISILNEGDKYLSSARLLAEGNAAEAFRYQIFYSVYISYLSLLQLLQLPHGLMIAVTWLFSLYAIWQMHKTLDERMTLLAARIWTTCLLLSPMVQAWQLTLYSEIFFISLSLLFAAWLFRMRSQRHILMMLVLALLLCFTRPAGIFTVLSLLFFYHLQRGRFKTKALTAIFISALLLIFGLLVFFVPMHYRGVCVDIASGSVYAGFPRLPHHELQPVDQTLASCYGSILQQHGWLMVTKLFFLKFFSFFNLNRPYFTGLHNFINGLHYLIYPLALASLYKVRDERSVSAWMIKGCLAIVFLNALLVALFFNEWSERYTVQIFPFILMAAVYPLSLMVQSKYRNPAV